MIIHLKKHHWKLQQSSFKDIYISPFHHGIFMTDTKKYLRLKTCNRYMVIKERWPPAIHLAQLG